MVTQSTFEFQWVSALGAGVFLFLFEGVVTAVIGIMTPVAIHRLLFIEPKMRGHFLFSAEADTPIFGQSPVELYRQFPFSKTIIEMWGTMLSGFLLAFSIGQLGLTWFGLRAGYGWALWLIIASNLVAVGYYWLLLIRPFARKTSLKFSDLHPFATLPTIIVPIAAALCWIGLG